MDKNHAKRDPHSRDRRKRKLSAAPVKCPDLHGVRNRSKGELLSELKKLNSTIADLEARLAESARRSPGKGGGQAVEERPPRTDPMVLDEKFRHLVERSQQGVLVAEGFPPRIVFANEALARILGFSTEELIAMTPARLKNLMHPDDREMLYRRYRDRLEGKKTPAHYELRIVRGDGTTGWIDMFATRLEQDGKPFVQATIIDVTERRYAEERMLQSEEKYRTVIDNIQDGYYEVDLAGNLTFCNDAAVEILGFDRDEMIGLNNRKFMEEENARKVYHTFNRVFRTRKPERATNWEIIRKDGTRRFIDASIALIRDSTGEPTGFRGILRDVTDEMLVQQALLASEKRYHDVYDIAPLAFVLWDPQQRITDWNRHAEEVFGWSRAEALGRDFVELLFPGRDLADRILGGDIPTHVITVNRTKSGENITCEWNSTVFYDRDGNTSEILSLALDITQRKNLEEELYQSRKMESIGRLAGGVAHDLNNMLTPILGYTDMILLDVPMDDSHLDSLIQIKEAAERARDLTRQLLAFSRKQMLEMKVVNLGETVCGFEKILRRTIREDIELDIMIQDNAGNVMTDASQIERIILNLAVNAQEAMPSGGKLRIEVSNVFLDVEHAKKHPDARPGRHVLLSISDTGCGMDGETLEHIFEPFYTTRALGTGLGLSTVYGIVKQHNGSILVNSRPERGTTVRIYFPRAEGDVTPRSAPPIGETITTKGETILVVEDEEAVRKLAARILEKHGYHVLTASCGEEALETVRSRTNRIDLLLTDIIMPRIDGKTLYRKIAALRNDMRVLYMSGYTHDVIANHGVVEKGVHFIQKPFSFQTLTEKIREALEA